MTKEITFENCLMGFCLKRLFFFLASSNCFNNFPIGNYYDHDKGKLLYQKKKENHQWMCVSFIVLNRWKCVILKINKESLDKNMKGKHHIG
jgi:hypothetical protein